VTFATKQRNPFYVQTGSMNENPWGVPEEEIVQMILEMPAETAAQFVFGKFVESSGLVFSAELINQMVDRSLPRVLSQTFLAEEYSTDAGQKALSQIRRGGGWRNRYGIGIDLARQTDHTVISVLDTQPMQYEPQMPARLVYWRRINKAAWETIYAEIGRAVMMFGEDVLIDSTGMAGDLILEAIQSRLYCPVHHQVVLLGQPRCLNDKGEYLTGCDRKMYFSMSGVEGYPFSQSSKRELIEHLRNVLSVGYTVGGSERTFGWIRTPPIAQLQEELALYLWDDKRLQTDCVMSLALASKACLAERLREIVHESVYGV
jgi:hypothetical protein